MLFLYSYFPYFCHHSCPADLFSANSYWNNHFFIFTTHASYTIAFWNLVLNLLFVSFSWCIGLCRFLLFHLSPLFPITCRANYPCSLNLVFGFLVGFCCACFCWNISCSLSSSQNHSFSHFFSFCQTGSAILFCFRCCWSFVLLRYSRLWDQELELRNCSHFVWNHLLVFDSVSVSYLFFQNSWRYFEYSSYPIVIWGQLCSIFTNWTDLCLRFRTESARHGF